MTKTIRHYAATLVAIACFALPRVAMAQAPEHQMEAGPRLDFPAGLATDGVSLYVANSRNNTIDKIDLASHSITLLAGTLFKDGSADGQGPNARFASPSGLALAGNTLYVVDTNNSILRAIALSSGNVTTAAGGTNLAGTDDGKGVAAHFNLPTQIAADPNGSRLFLTDTGNSVIRMIAVPDMVVKTIAGQPQVTGKDDGPGAKATFNRPRGIATDGKFVYVSDTGNGVMRKIDLSNMTVSTIAGTGEEGNKNGAGTEAQFNNPGAMTTDGTNLYVMDADNHAIRKIVLATNEVSTLTLVNGHIGSGCTMKQANVVYFSDTTENSVQQADTSNGNVNPVYPLQ